MVEVTVPVVDQANVAPVSVVGSEGVCVSDTVGADGLIVHEKLAEFEAAGVAHLDAEGVIARGEARVGRG